MDTLQIQREKIDILGSDFADLRKLILLRFSGQGEAIKVLEFKV